MNPSIRRAPEHPDGAAEAVSSIPAWHSYDADPDNRNGYAPFPPAIVVSTQRSGLNLVRHAVETVAGRRTPGRTHRYSHGPLAFHRTHWARSMLSSPSRAPVFEADGQSPYRKLLLILRDPLEIFPRAFDCDITRMPEYCDNILAFDTFGGEKLLVAYDDLVCDDSALQRVFDFLEIGATISVQQVASVRSGAVEWYQVNQAIGGGSQTLGSSDRLKHHQQRLTPEQRTQLLAFLRATLGALASRHLSRWIG